MSNNAVVITGASSGIGLAIARLLSENNFQVFGTVRNEKDARKISALKNGTPIFMEITDVGSIETAAREVKKNLGSHTDLVGLVNNAGILVGGPLAHVTAEQMRGQFNVNVVGPISAIQAFLPQLQSGKGRIINISSSTGRVSYPFLGPYSASKHALEALSDALRVELMPFGIRVIVIQPGLTATSMWDKTAALEQQYSDTVYGPALDNMKKMNSQWIKNAFTPEKVARSVLTALTAKRPRTRYFIIKNRIEAFLMEHLPDRILDFLMYRALGLKQLKK